ncbi:ketoacyl-ACP synthase III family protein [Streptomyces sp. NPDC048516]|uniref:ketoacyl-ACP synthase III family protein n=1 Tax=Streptomyces sp. NPDC048516 TaxID=3365565 RepID=UPI0037187A31
MKTHDIHVQALGVHLPPDRVTLEEAIEQGLCTRDEFFESDLVGVPVAGRSSTVDMAVDAGRQALQRANLDPAALDLLVHAPMAREVPEAWAPSGYILRELKCGPTAAHTVSQGCNATLAGLELAAGWLSLAAARSTALVTSALKAEPPYYERWRSAGFGMALGDGASAVLVGRAPGIARIDAINSVTHPDLEGLHRGSLDLSDQAALAHQKVDVPARAREYAMEPGFDSFDLHRMFSTMYADVARLSLDEHGIGPEDLKRVLFTNAGAALIEADVMQPLGLPMELSTWDYGRTIGHIGASDQILSLDHLFHTGELAVGDRVLLVGGTQGYNVSSVLLTVTAPVAPDATVSR